MNKFKNFIQSKKGKVVAVAGIVGTALASAIPTFADDTTSSGIGSISTSLSTGLQNAGNDALSVIGTVLPYALPILAAGIAITLGIRFFKRAAK